MQHLKILGREQDEDLKIVIVSVCRQRFATCLYPGGDWQWDIGSVSRLSV
jgi:hypothetical protein